MQGANTLLFFFASSFSLTLSFQLPFGKGGLYRLRGFVAEADIFGFGCHALRVCPPGCRHCGVLGLVKKAKPLKVAVHPYKQFCIGRLGTEAVAGHCNAAFCVALDLGNPELAIEKDGCDCSARHFSTL
nr:hypothetical protein [Devosia sp.]